MRGARVAVDLAWIQYCMGTLGVRTGMRLLVHEHFVFGRQDYIILSSNDKHTLPVDLQIAVTYSRGIVANESSTREHILCAARHAYTLIIPPPRRTSRCGSTFYFIRCQKNPKFYGLPTGLADGGLYGHMQKTCLSGLKKVKPKLAIDRSLPLS